MVSGWGESNNRGGERGGEWESCQSPVRCVQDWRMSVISLHCYSACCRACCWALWFFKKAITGLQRYRAQPSESNSSCVVLGLPTALSLCHRTGSHCSFPADIQSLDCTTYQKNMWSKWHCHQSFNLKKKHLSFNSISGHNVIWPLLVFNLILAPDIQHCFCNYLQYVAAASLTTDESILREAEGRWSPRSLLKWYKPTLINVDRCGWGCSRMARWPSALSRCVWGREGIKTHRVMLLYMMYRTNKTYP